MRIGITIPYASANFYGGVNVQCRMWQQGLTQLGHKVDLLNPWEKFEYNDYDYLIIVGLGILVSDYVDLYKRFDRPKIVSAPVLDPTISIRQFKLRCRYYGSKLLRYHTILHDYYLCRNVFSFFLVRSEFEKSYIVEGLGVPESKVRIVPISMRFQENPIFNLEAKENTCLHVSKLQRPEKNVERLIKAAKKYGFRLKLAGTLDGVTGVSWLKSLIGDANNIEYIGKINDEELVNEYRRAKVFALPSLNEGVGMVALEAAAYGCEICLTNLGAPKEYYNRRAVLVDPYDIDSIGEGVLEALNTKSAQPESSGFILKNYSVNHCMQTMDDILKEYLAV